MGYSIYYDRAFVRVGDKYIPLVISGASNCSDYVRGREVPEKNWDVLNWNRRDRVLFTDAEIREIAKDYERIHQESGMCFKSRSKPFAPGEFERWIVGGMRRAYSIDEYISGKNTLFVVDYPNGMAERWRTQPFSTDAELFSIIEKFRAGTEFHISFGYQREVYRHSIRKAHDHDVGSAKCGVLRASEPATDQPASEKTSVLGMIAQSCDVQRRSKADGFDAPTPVKKKSKDPEL